MYNSGYAEAVRLWRACGFGYSLGLVLRILSGWLRELAMRMSELAKGLMDFSHRETKREPFPVNDLVLRTVELIRPQTRFRNLEVVVDGHRYLIR